jgi:hypothetical protein
MGVSLQLHHWILTPAGTHTPHHSVSAVAVQGATITRWIDELGKNLLFVRPDAVFEEGRAIK